MIDYVARWIVARRRRVPYPRIMFTAVNVMRQFPARPPLPQVHRVYRGKPTHVSGHENPIDTAFVPDVKSAEFELHTPAA